MIRLIVLLLLLSVPALAQTPAPKIEQPKAPTVTIPAPPANASHQARINARAAAIQKQLNDLSPNDQQEVMKQVKVAKPILTDAEKEQLKQSRFAKTLNAWQGKSEEEKAELRDGAHERWIALTPQQKGYQRDKMVEKLKALPAEDRQKIIEAAGK